jgi:hypothetical protein
MARSSLVCPLAYVAHAWQCISRPPSVHFAPACWQPWCAPACSTPLLWLHGCLREGLLMLHDNPWRLFTLVTGCTEDHAEVLCCGLDRECAAADTRCKGVLL